MRLIMDMSRAEADELVQVLVDCLEDDDADHGLPAESRRLVESVYQIVREARLAARVGLSDSP